MPAFLRTIALGIGLLGAVGSSQLPEYAQQYTQRLGGHVDELRAFVADFDRDARAVNLDRVRALEALNRDASELVRRRGEDATVRLARHERLDAHYREMSATNGVGRAWALFTKGDAEIARRAFVDYKPAVPVTLDGALSALAGFLAAFLATIAVGRLFTRLFRRPKTPFVPVNKSAKR